MISQDELTATLTKLEEEIEGKGWDAPHFLYSIQEDGTFDLVLEIANGHPYDTISSLNEYGQTFKDKPEVIGLALSTETWRHITGRELREIAKGDPKLRQFLEEVDPLVDEALAKASEVMDNPLPSDVRDEALDLIWARWLMNQHFNPTDAPKHMRGEMRCVFAIFRDQRPVTIIWRDRNQQQYPGLDIEHRPHAIHLGGSEPGEARVPKVVWTLLTGEVWTG